MAGVRETEVFNRSDRVVEGWYWALPSAELPRGGVRKLRMLGRELVAWRGEDGVAHLFDAHCPHMGAHLGEGKVDGDGLRCFFHAWRFDGAGALTHIPCQEHLVPATVRAWPVEERYGLLWLWPGERPRHPVPFVPELDGRPLRHRLGNRFVKACHPNVVMVNAIDEQHFASVHDLIVDLHFDITERSEAAITFDNATAVPRDRWLGRLLAPLYAGPLTYRMTYWSGTTGSVTVGPDLWHFHIVFALRPGEGGATEGQTILLTPRVEGPTGWLWNRVALALSAAVGDHFAKGDTEVFQSIRWDFQTPLKADRSIVHFVRHLERQPTLTWGDWEPTHAARPSLRPAEAHGGG